MAGDFGSNNLTDVVMTRGLVSKASIRINAPVSVVWDAFVNPGVISKYMFGTKVVSEWREGSPIAWRGVWKGKAYEDRGTVLELKLGRILRYSHFSGVSGLPDVPENYHTVTIELEPSVRDTTVSLTQDNNETEQGRRESEKNWEAMLGSLKKLLESRPGRGPSPVADR
jgi:uncharacterized protein YndB with AHSA1/START domain